MPDWERQRENYKQLGRLADKKYEDLIGRRIIRGLGFTNAPKAIYGIEQQLLGTSYGEEPLYNRAVRVFQHLLTKRGELAFAQEGWNWQPEARLIKDYTEIVERINSGAYTGLPLIFTRLKAGKESRTYMCWPIDDINTLLPPFKVLRTEPIAVGEFWLVEMDTAHFVGQFGPFMELTGAHD